MAVTLPVAATQVLTVTGQPLNTETVVVGGKTYTFQTTLTNVDGNVLIGASASASLDNLKAAINLEAGAGTLYATATTAHPNASVSAKTATTLTVKAHAPGTIGNILGTTETLTNGSWGAATMTGGTGSVKQWVADVTAERNEKADTLQDLTKF